MCVIVYVIYKGYHIHKLNVKYRTSIESEIVCLSKSVC